MRDLATLGGGLSAGTPWWTETFGITNQRADRYSALAGLLRFPVAAPGREILVAIEMADELPVDGLLRRCDVQRTRDAALEWVERESDASALADEHIRLFAGNRSMGVPSCPVSTFGDRTRGEKVIRHLVSEYRRFGFMVADDALAHACPGHASNVLAFMSHCLLVADLGVPAAAGAARSFYSRFLRDWMPGFGEAVCREANHPVFALTGIAAVAFGCHEARDASFGAVSVDL